MSIHVYTEPFITNELLLLYSDIQLVGEYDVIHLHTIVNIALHKNVSKSKIIIFVKTEYLLHYIQFLLNFPKTFILLTSCNDDFCMPYFNYPVQNVNNSNITIELLQCPKLDVWYTKNPCITFQKLKPFPMGPKWQWDSGVFFGEDPTTHLNIYRKYGMNGYENFQNINKKPNLLYFNYGCSTTENPFIQSHKNIRNIWKKNIETKFKWNADKPFEEYIIELSSYKFCVSPPGRGVDTHRTWEALMVGTIPIMLSTPLDPLFEKLPVIIIHNIDDIQNITPEFLQNQYEMIHTKTYDFSIIYSSYWKTLFHELSNT
jgi:hypothetical protein